MDSTFKNKFAPDLYCVHYAIKQKKESSYVVWTKLTPPLNDRFLKKSFRLTKIWPWTAFCRPEAIIFCPTYGQFFYLSALGFFEGVENRLDMRKLMHNKEFARDGRVPRIVSWDRNPGIAPGKRPVPRQHILASSDNDRWTESYRALIEN